MYKYRINEVLLNLPMKDYRKALKVLPDVLKISLNTFTNYRNIKVFDNQDIPHQKVVAIEKIFGLKPGGLGNMKPEYKSIKELLDEYNDQI